VPSLNVVRRVITGVQQVDAKLSSLLASILALAALL
jgi:hypothetical protein